MTVGPDWVMLYWAQLVMALLADQLELLVLLVPVLSVLLLVPWPQ